MAGGKNIGKLSIGVDLDASKAQSGLTDLVQKIELFQASVSNFGSLALNLAGFASIGAIMGKVAYDAARFADQIERAKKNSDIAISIRQGNIDWDKQWNEAGPVGKLRAIPGRFMEAAGMGAGRAISDLGTLLPESYLDHVNKKMTEIRNGERGMISGFARMVPFLSELDQLSDMIVPWGKDGWSSSLKSSKFLPGKDVVQFGGAVSVYDDTSDKQTAERIVADTEKMLATPEKLLEMKLDELDEQITKMNYLEFVDNRGDTHSKYRDAIAALEKQKVFTKQKFDDGKVAEEIAKQQAALDQANLEAEKEILEKEQQRNKALSFLESVTERGLSGYEEFTYKTKKLMEAYEKAAKDIGNPADAAKLKEATDKLIKRDADLFARQGESQYEKLANDQAEAMNELENAKKDGNNDAITVAKRRLAAIATQVAGLAPEKINVDPFSFGASVRGTTEFGRDMMAGMFPKEITKSMDERYAEGSDKIKGELEKTNDKMDKLITATNAKPLNINWKGGNK